MISFKLNNSKGGNHDHTAHNRSIYGSGICILAIQERQECE